jgi:glycosyltransferase involved in cell wall biosynthesis
MAGSKKHILFIASWYPNRNAPALGNFIQQHARAASLENKISVVYASAEKNIEEGKSEITETHSGNLSEYIVYYGKVKSKLPVISKLKKRDAYRNAIKSGVENARRKNGDFDLIHLHVIWPAALAVIPLLHEFKLPLIISEHWSGYLPEDGNYKGIVQKNISKQIADKAEHITVVSPRMEEAMKKHGLGKSFSLLPNTVNTEIFNQKPETRNQKFKLLHVSMLVDREKNISGLLSVMEQLKDHPEIILEILGDGPERERLEAIATGKNILNKTVFFKGFKSAIEIAEEMQRSSALIMFSNFEGMPVTIIEAQCCGLPVIATRTGSIPEMINTAEGILVNPGDEAALKNAILQLKENYPDYSQEKISTKAISAYSLDAIGKQLDELYRFILKKNGR